MSICEETGKIKHATKKFAMKAAFVSYQKEPLPGKTLADLSAYRCDCCKRWHWGHKKKYRF